MKLLDLNLLESRTLATIFLIIYFSGFPITNANALITNLIKDLGASLIGWASKARA